MLADLLHSDRHAADIIYFSLASFRGRLDIITNLATETLANNGRKSLLITLLKRISRLAETRNQLIHSSMIGTPDDLARQVRKPGKKRPLEFIPVKKNDLTRHANTLVMTCVQLQLLIDPKTRKAVAAALADEGLDGRISPERPK